MKFAQLSSTKGHIRIIASVIITNKTSLDTSEKSYLSKSCYLYSKQMLRFFLFCFFFKLKTIVVCLFFFP